MKRYRVHGHVGVEVTTVIEVEDGEELSEFQIYERALNEFDGIENYAGFGDCDHLIGVSGEDDTIFCSGDVEFDDYEEEDSDED